MAVKASCAVVNVRGPRRPGDLVTTPRCSHPTRRMRSLMARRAGARGWLKGNGASPAAKPKPTDVGCPPARDSVGVGISSPLSETSPANAYRARRVEGTWAVAASTPMALHAVGERPRDRGPLGCRTGGGAVGKLGDDIGAAAEAVVGPGEQVVGAVVVVVVQQAAGGGARISMVGPAGSGDALMAAARAAICDGGDADDDEPPLRVGQYL